MFMERTYIKDLSAKVGQEVTIKGWVDIRRDQGKLIFLDFRDVTGKVQGVILPNATAAHEVGVTSIGNFITFNKPFVFAIAEKSTGAILFIGRMMKPE